MRKTTVHYLDPDASFILVNTIYTILKEHQFAKHKIIVCIGSDRSTGDSMGPLVGSFLKESIDNLIILGTLHDPVHAVNIHEQMNFIERNYKDSFIMAVDACIGQEKNIGCINIFKGSLTPGAGVGKNLPKIGHYSITGVVNSGGFYEFQSTRLSVVYDMSKVISNSIIRAVNYL